MAATQSLYRTIASKKTIKTLVARGATLDSATRPLTITATTSQLKRVGINTRRRKLLTARTHWTAA